jgi:uncharacterized FAD-dependent dehydrogenase
VFLLPYISSDVKSLTACEICFCFIEIFRDAFGIYAQYVEDFINDMNKVFNFGEDWGMYIPEVKYLTGEPIVDYSNLELKQYPDVHFVGDALSARGITVAGSQGIYVAEYLLKQ